MVCLALAVPVIQPEQAISAATYSGAAISMRRQPGAEGEFGDGEGINFVDAENEGVHHHWRMSALALEIDQTLQQLDAATALQLERLVRDALALVRVRPVGNAPVAHTDIQFPLVRGAKPITSEDVARLEDAA